MKHLVVQPPRDKRNFAPQPRKVLRCTNCGGRIATTVPLAEQCKCTIFDRGRIAGKART